MPPSPDRASAADLMQFATGDGRAAGHIGAVLLLGAAPGFTVAEARRVLGERIRAVPRLRQRLYRAPPGCGRPYWADDPAFDINDHVRQVCCPPPGDERALLDLAAAQLREPMPRSPAAVVGHVRHRAGRRRHRAARHHGSCAGGRHRWAGGARHAGRPGRRDGTGASEPVPGTGAASAGTGRRCLARPPAAGGAGRAWRAAPGAWPAPDPRGNGRTGGCPATAPAAGDIAQPAGRAAAAARRRRRRPGRRS